MSETSEEKFSMFDNFLHFLRIFVFGPFFADQVTTMPQFDMQNMLLLFSFFLCSHHDTNPLLHLYHFRKNI